MSFNMTSQTCSAASPKRIFNSSIVRILGELGFGALETTYLSDCIIILDGEQAAREQDLQLFDNDFSRFVDADKGADDITGFAGAKLCR
jgi:hypothetical protein